MSNSVAFKPTLAIAAALGLLSMGACETGKGLSLSAADLAAAGTVNHNLQSGSGGMWANLDAPNQSMTTPASQSSTNSPSGTPTTAAASAKSARTLASMTDTAASNTDVAGGVPTAAVMHMAGNAVLASGDDITTIADLTPASGAAGIVESTTDPIGQHINTGGATAQTDGALAIVTPATAPFSGATNVTVAGLPAVGTPGSPTAPVGIAILSAGPTAGTLASVGLLNSGTPVNATVVGTSLVSTSTGNAANASNSATSLVGVTTASTTQTTGTLASVAVVNGSQLAMVGVGSTPVLSVPMNAVAPPTPDASGTTAALGSSAALVQAPAGSVVAGNSSNLLGATPSSVNG